MTDTIKDLLDVIRYRNKKGIGEDDATIACHSIDAVDDIAAMVDEIDDLKSEAVLLREGLEDLYQALSCAVGYMTSASIDLAGNTPKATAKATIDGGIKKARTVLAKYGEVNDVAAD